MSHHKVPKKIFNNVTRRIFKLSQSKNLIRDDFFVQLSGCLPFAHECGVDFNSSRMVWPCLKGRTQRDSENARHSISFSELELLSCQKNQKSQIMRDFFPQRLQPFHGFCQTFGSLQDQFHQYTGFLFLLDKDFIKVMILEHLEREPYSSHNRRRSF